MENNRFVSAIEDGIDAIYYSKRKKLCLYHEVLISGYVEYKTTVDPLRTETNTSTQSHNLR